MPIASATVELKSGCCNKLFSGRNLADYQLLKNVATFGYSMRLPQVSEKLSIAWCFGGFRLRAHTDWCAKNCLEYGVIQRKINIESAPRAQ